MREFARAAARCTADATPTIFECATRMRRVALAVAAAASLATGAASAQGVGVASAPAASTAVFMGATAPSLAVGPAAEPASSQDLQGPLASAPASTLRTDSAATAAKRVPDTLLPLPADVSQTIRASGLPVDQIGMIAIELSEGQTLAALNAERAFNPASTMKLLTTFAAMSMLGPEYRWHTGAYLGGRLNDGVLDGDLILRGGGDPKLVIEDLTQFVARMRAAGLREIRGDLVIDDSIYQSDAKGDETLDGDPSQPYNVRPYGLLMNFKSTRVVAQPVGKRVGVLLDPPLADVELDNAINASPGKCKFGAGGLSVRDSGSDARAQIRVGGPYSPACGEQGTFAAVLTHRQFIHSLFKASWLAAGGTWTGQTRIEAGRARGLPWVDWESPRNLAEVVQDVNKFSNNVMARQLLLQTAAVRGPRPASIDRARRQLTGWLDTQGMKFPELVIENGAGLSRNERISPEHMAQLLRQIAVSNYGDVMRGSLPMVGVDGTMKNRLVGAPIAGHAWIKTGSLNDVRAVAGYVNAQGGKRYAVVMVINGPRAEAGMRVLDSFLEWVYANG